MSQGLGSAAALSVPLNTLSPLTGLQLSQGLFSWHLESLQRSVLQNQGSTWKYLETPYPLWPENILSEFLPSCPMAAENGVQGLCVVLTGPRTAKGKHLPTWPYALASSTRAFTSRLPSHASCPWYFPSGKLGCSESHGLCVLAPHQVPLCSCGRQGARVL